MNLQLRQQCNVFIARLGDHYHVIYPNQREWVIDSPENNLTNAHLKADRCMEALRFNTTCKDLGAAAVYTLNIADALIASLLNGLHSGEKAWQTCFDQISVTLDRYQHILTVTLSNEPNNDLLYLSIIGFNPRTSEQTVFTFTLSSRQPGLQIQAKQNIHHNQVAKQVKNKNAALHAIRPATEIIFHSQPVIDLRTGKYAEPGVWEDSGGPSGISLICDSL